MKRMYMLICLALALAGCFAPKQLAPVKQTFTFDYTPTQTGKPGSADMVLAFISPYYAKNFASGNGELFRRFRGAIASDIEELIVGKGFSLKGPYQALDEMVFEDKKRADILIDIEIAPQFTAQQGGWKTNGAILGPNFTTYSYKGTVSIVGKINISGIEPLTNEKIWSKSVSIPNVEQIPIETSNKYEQQLSDAQLVNDPGVYNELGKALEKQYSGIMDKISAHFNVEELNSLKAQIKELKAKKGY